jgi:hypothetical protein
MGYGLWEKSAIRYSLFAIRSFGREACRMTAAELTNVRLGDFLEPKA